MGDCAQRHTIEREKGAGGEREGGMERWMEGGREGEMEEGRVLYFCVVMI
jgi:hypothetical protein